MCFRQKTHFKSDTSLPKKLTMLDVNMKLEKTVNKPAITVIVNKKKAEKQEIHYLSIVDSIVEFRDDGNCANAND